MRSTLWVMAAVLLLAVGGYLGYLAFRAPELPPEVLYGSGRIEATQVQLASEIPGRVTDNRLIEGQHVRAGEELLRLNDSTLHAQLGELQARQRAARHAVVRLDRMLETARHHLSNAETDLERARALSRAGDIPPQQLERAQDRLREAAGQVGVLEAQHAEAVAGLDAMQQQLAQLKLQLDKTVLRSPLDATVLVKAVETGEVVAPGRALAILVDLERPRLKIYVPEGVLGRIRLGAPARVQISAFPGRYFDAEVSSIDGRAQFTPRDVHVPDERARTVFGVTLRIANADGALRPGMPADAWILWNEEAAWPDALPVPR
jgi:HlyD family secretion protein